MKGSSTDQLTQCLETEETCLSISISWKTGTLLGRCIPMIFVLLLALGSIGIGWYSLSLYLDSHCMPCLVGKGHCLSPMNSAVLVVRRSSL
jgi:hypothetical protein